MFERRSKVVLSDEELVKKMKSERKPKTQIEAELVRREVSRKEQQEKYHRATDRNFIQELHKTKN